jgi:nitrogen-specific signal transduction histidine kinase/ActR/RegA family two-component response regulator
MFDKARPADQHLHKLEALGHFAGGIAHDFNNILSIIEGYTTQALRQLAEGRPCPDTLQKILTSTERGASLTRQLLAFARQNVDLSASVEMGAVMAQQAVLLRPLLGEGIVFSLPQAAAPVHLALSADQFTQILMNLAINARDAMSRNGELTVTACEVAPDALPDGFRARARQTAYMRVSVADNGSGIAPADLPHIFDPFFTTKRQAEGGGTGLGLSVVYGIVDQVGGMIDVSSTPGAGTCFDVYLPLAPVPEAAPAGRGDEISGALAGRTILVAEDEPELRDVLSLMFDDLQMKVLPAANGNEALRLQAEYEGEIDFLLTDIVMPGMDGVHLSDLFRQERPESNVVLMSGYPFLAVGRPLEVPEGADFVSKPFRCDKIRQILERALARKAERLAAEAQPSGDADGPRDAP